MVRGDGGAAGGRSSSEGSSTTPTSRTTRCGRARNAFGTTPGTTLATSPLTGEVSWHGSLLGVDTGVNELPPVTGKAQLDIALETLQGTASFTELTVHGAQSTPFRKPALNLPRSRHTNNGFQSIGGQVRGALHGPTHQEMAGVLDDRSDPVNLLAGFGGVRKTGG